MKLKKSPKATLENYSKLFLQLGLVLALFLVYEFIEIKSYDRTFKSMKGVIVSEELKEDTQIIPKIEIDRPLVQAPAIPEQITIVEDELDVSETIIESTETDEFEAVVTNVKPDNIIEEEIEEEVEEDVAFLIIEEVPVFPGCEGNKQQLRDCLSQEIDKFVKRKFNADLALELGLSPGKKKIFVIFKIDKYGNVTDVQARAPHVRLQKEAIKVVSALPKMTPGKQRGKPVGVKYSLPITFNVE